MLMKIYFYRYNNICEPAVIDAFKRLVFMAGNTYLSLILFQKNITKLIIS